MKKIFTTLALFMCINLFAQPPGWIYNQPITVTNPNGVNAVDYQLKLTVNTQALIALNKMTATGSDIRFGGTCTGNTFYNYWIEGGINTTATTIWVKIPLIAANTSSTVFMFYGNNVAVAASTIQGTFRGPNSATDSVTVGTTNLTPGSCQRGFRFAPTQNMLITHFGKNEPNGTLRYVTLFNYATQAILSQTQVAGPASTYTYGPMSSPMWLTSGTQYVLQMYTSAAEGYYYGVSSQIGQHLTYFDMQYSAGTQNTFPNSTLAGYHYGLSDFLYYITNTLAITPTYTLGGSLINITGISAPVCSGNSVTLTTNATGTYSWNTGSTTSSIVVSPTTTSSYSVSEYNPTGCNSNALLTVTVNQGLPTLTVVNTSSASGGICPTKTVALTANGANTYTWTGGSATVTNGIVFSPNATYIYTVNGTNACGTRSAVTSVSVHPLPTIIAVASTASLCSGSSVTLTTTGSNASTYTWTGGFTSGTGFVPAATSVYTVTGTSALTCTALATVQVSVVNTPTAFPTANPLLICLGNSSTLTASSANNYTWTGATQTVFTSTMLVTPTSSGVTTYTVTKANGVCIDTKVLSLTTNDLPTVLVLATPTLVCATHAASLAAAGGQTYTWTASAPANYTFTGASPVVYPAVNTTYTVAANDGTCVNTAVISVSTNPLPSLTITPTPASASLCAGQQVNLAASGGVNYTWTTVNTTSTGANVSDSPTAAIVYNLEGDNIYGCTSTAQQVILVYPNPTVNISITKNPMVCTGGQSTVSASGANTYTWDANAGGVHTNTAAVTSSNSTTGPVVYTVSGSYNSTGCSSSKTIAISVFIPTLTVTGNTNTCDGGNVTLSAGGGNTYSWTTAPGNPPYTFPTITASLNAPTVFTLAGITTTSGISCPSSMTIGLGIYYNPTITATAERTLVCKGEEVNLMADGGVTYVWSNSQPGGTITVIPTSISTYTAYGTDANGCTGAGTVLVRYSSCNAISELDASNTEVVIYPNPNSGQFVIKAASDLNLTISNELGQAVRFLQLSGANEHKISVEGLAQGIYFVTGKGVNQKIVVTK